MAKKSKDEMLKDAIEPHLEEGETLEHYAFGVKQPHIALIIVLMCLAILPGVIATALLTKNYIIGTTNKRLIVVETKGMAFHKVKAVFEYALSSLSSANVTTKTGAIFTHITIKDDAQPFVAKFHRAFSKNNKPYAEAIAQTLAG